MTKFDRWFDKKVYDHPIGMGVAIWLFVGLTITSAYIFLDWLARKL